jgi:hypothetical protein
LFLTKKVSLREEVHMVCWLDLFHGEVLANFIVMSVITCWGLAIFTHHFGRPVSGGCVDCRAPFPGVKKDFHWISKSASCLVLENMISIHNFCTKLVGLNCLMLNMSISRCFLDMIESGSIIFVLEITILMRRRMKSHMP